jgi:glutamate---cysteine ligase / carboxylate-amine ligase
MTPPLHLFDGYGVELEYMIVAADTLDVRPTCDEVLLRASQQSDSTTEAQRAQRVIERDSEEVDLDPSHLCAPSVSSVPLWFNSTPDARPSDVEFPDVTWCNELALHVIEIKTTEPAPSLTGLARQFHDHAQRINAVLKPLNARLMPGGMHPWMNPDAELKLWPHECNVIYETFDRIFSCRGHGWANLQSAHLNLPFQGDDEFGRLHAAIRLVLPILPALAASTPVFDGRISSFRDARLEAYRTNSARVPSVTGQVIPEPVFTIDGYQRDILQRLYRDIAPFDPEHVLRYEEWLNARGAIARFGRGSLEIRLLDVQECPAADLAVIAAVVEVVRALVEERWIGFESQLSWPVEPLASIFLDTVRDAEDAVIDNADYLTALGFIGRDACRAGDLWRRLVERVVLSGANFPSELAEPLKVILDEGTLATRIIRALNDNPDREALHRVYGALCEALDRGEMFRG